MTKQCSFQTYHPCTILGNVKVSRRNPNDIRVEIEQAARRLNIIKPEETFIDYEEFWPWERRGAESYGAAFTVVIATPAGKQLRRQVYAKAVVRGFGAEGTALYIANELKRLALLEAYGIPAPHIYGTEQGVIYREYLGGDWKATLGRLLEYSLPSHFRRQYLDQLARIAAVLDTVGAQVIGHFLRNLWEDEAGKLYLIDGGEDLGHLDSNTPSTPHGRGYLALIQLFTSPDDRALVDQIYNKCYCIRPKQQ